MQILSNTDSNIQIDIKFLLKCAGITREEEYPAREHYIINASYQKLGRNLMNRKGWLQVLEPQ